MIALTRSFRRACLIVMFCAGVAAGAEVDTQVVLLFFGGGLVGLLLTTWIIAKDKDETYTAEVDSLRSPSDPASESIGGRTDFSILANCIVGFVCFLAFGGWSLYLKSPFPMIGFFVLMTGFGVRYAYLNRHAGHEVWKAFAAASGLEHDPGDLFDYRKPEMISGVYRDRNIELSEMNQSHGESIGSSNGRFAIAVSLSDLDASFCVDNMQFDRCTNPMAKRLLTHDALKSRFFNAQPRRVSVYEGKLSLHTEVFPLSSIELRFFCDLLCDAAEILESNR